jgi:hypothetical protein
VTQSADRPGNGVTAAVTDGRAPARRAKVSAQDVGSSFQVMEEIERAAHLAVFDLRQAPIFGDFWKTLIETTPMISFRALVGYGG